MLLHQNTGEYNKELTSTTASNFNRHIKLNLIKFTSLKILNLLIYNNSRKTIVKDKERHGLLSHCPPVGEVAGYSDEQFHTSFVCPSIRMCACNNFAAGLVKSLTDCVVSRIVELNELS